MTKPHTGVRAAIDRRFLAMAVLACLSWQTSAGGAQCETRSSTIRVTVLELYTSEGCSSCPPADRWLSALPARGFTPDRVVPLAFHVDYWDQLGWPDRMANAQFSARQRMQAQRNRASVIYTPQLLLNGADYRKSFSDSGFADRVNELNRLPAAADLVLRQRPVSSNIEVDLEAQLVRTAGNSAQTYVAITENGLQSEIRAGENQGKLLHHDFVVREFVGPLPMDATGRVRWRSAMALNPGWKRPDLSLVAFVQDARNGEILQAVQAPLCAGP